TQERERRIELPGGQYEHGTSEQDRDRRFANSDQSGRELASRRARVLCVDLSIHDSVEPHRGEPCRREREHDPAQRRNRDPVRIARERRPDQREGQCEYRVRQFDEVHIPHEPGSAVERLPLSRSCHTPPPPAPNRETTSPSELAERSRPLAV